jgi:hypothetical protein
MPARPRRSPRPRPAPQRCSWEDCRRVGQGSPPLCADHAIEAEEYTSQFEETVDGVIDGVLEHPRVQRLADRFYGLLEQAAAVLEQVKRGEMPAARRAAPAGTPAPGAGGEAAARAVLHFDPAEALTKDKIRVRFRALAQLVHPDHGGSNAAMAKLNEAAKLLYRACP